VVQGLIQGMMAGIGFLGAGVILRKPEADSVKGLTTAATVWLAAALGICCGLGQWTVVIVAVVLGLLILVVAKRLFINFNVDMD
jgi:putative Mg2+ transporter-C (MgtC) family protein